MAQRGDVDSWAGVFQPHRQRVHLCGRRFGDLHGAAQQGGDGSGGLVGGELVGGYLDPLAEHDVAGLQDMDGECQHVGERYLLQQSGPGYRAGPAAGGQRCLVPRVPHILHEVDGRDDGVRDATAAQVLLDSVFAVDDGHAGGLAGTGDGDIDQMADTGSAGGVDDVTAVPGVGGRPGCVCCPRRDDGVGLCGRCPQAGRVIEVRSNRLCAGLAHQPRGG